MSLTYHAEQLASRIRTALGRHNDPDKHVVALVEELVAEVERLLVQQDKLAAAINNPVAACPNCHATAGYENVCYGCRCTFFGGKYEMRCPACKQQDNTCNN